MLSCNMEKPPQIQYLHWGELPAHTLKPELLFVIRLNKVGRGGRSKGSAIAGWCWLRTSSIVLRPCKRNLFISRAPGGKPVANQTCCLTSSRLIRCFGSATRILFSMSKHSGDACGCCSIQHLWSWHAHSKVWGIFLISAQDIKVRYQSGSVSQITR